MLRKMAVWLRSFKTHYERAGKFTYVANFSSGDVTTFYCQCEYGSVDANRLTGKRRNEHSLGGVQSMNAVRFRGVWDKWDARTVERLRTCTQSHALG